MPITVLLELLDAGIVSMENRIHFTRFKEVNRKSDFDSPTSIFVLVFLNEMPLNFPSIWPKDCAELSKKLYSGNMISTSSVVSISWLYT
jgi:hypothetical protein